jgi:hypothetical protein
MNLSFSEIGSPTLLKTRGFAYSLADQEALAE